MFQSPTSSRQRVHNVGKLMYMFPDSVHFSDLGALQIIFLLTYFSDIKFEFWTESKTNEARFENDHVCDLLKQCCLSCWVGSTIAALANRALKADSDNVALKAFLPCDALRCTVFVIVILSVCLSVRLSVTLVDGLLKNGDFRFFRSLYLPNLYI